MRDTFAFLYRARDVIEGHLLLHALANAGITARLIGGQMLYGAVDSGGADLWIERKDLDRARGVIEAYQAKS